MKKNYFVALLALFVNLATAQIAPTTYRGAFAPAPTTQWTDGWTNFDPNAFDYPAVTNTTATNVTAAITTNTTWTSDKVYDLKGTIFVKNNATLTIEAGTVIRSSTPAAALIITRGAKLNAVGTALAPIVFTSKNAQNQRSRGDWGGIVILGKGRYNINNGEQYIEGITQSNDTQFGGGLNPINNDNSGTLQYVRIEFAGYVFSVDNELNGLTMGGVGSATTIDHIQVSYSNDDSFEWFGGSVNCSYLVALAGLDDDFDTDFGFNGKVQFGLSLKDPNGFDISTSECFESDNSNTATTGINTGNATTDAWKTSAILSNFTCIGPVGRALLTTPTVSLSSLHDTGARIRRASQLKVFNSLFLDFKRGLRLGDGSVTNFTTDNTTLWQNNIIASSFSPATPLVTISNAITSKYAEGSNTSLTTSDNILTTLYPAASTTAAQPSYYVGLDYRPKAATTEPLFAGSPALSGASFTNAVFTGLLTVNTTALPIVAVSSYTYCKGAVATQLSAVADSNATALKWYTVGGTATVPTYTLLPAAPTPLTTAAGIKKYAVSQVLNGDESNKVIITVETLNPPTNVLATIVVTNSAAATVTSNVTSFMGDLTATGVVTFTTSATPALTTGQTIQWAVPDGATILTGQGTVAITVRFFNKPASISTYQVSAQFVNSNGCTGTPKVLALTATLPVAPAFKMFNSPAVLSATGAAVAVTGFAQYMQTNQTLDLTVAPAAAGATSYVWELPTNVKAVLGTAVTSTTVKYYLIYPFVAAPLTSIPTSLSSGSSTNVGKRYYEVTDTLYNNGVTITSVKLLRVNSYTAVPLSQTTEVLEVITNTINGVTISPVFPIISTTGLTLPINFTDLLPANTYEYTTTTAGVVTNAIRVGVSSRNGVGLSIKNNATLAINGSTTVTSTALLSGSTASLLTLLSTRPAAPAAVTITNPAFTGTAATTAITIISKYIGTDTTLRLSATASVLASSYEWELPSWVNIVEGNPLTDRVILVNFAGNINAAAPLEVTSYYFGARAKNGIDYSLTNNATLTPVTTSTAKLLKVTTTLPAIVATVSGQIASLCAGQTVTYSFIASPLANKYTITAPEGSTVTSSSNPSNVGNVLTSSSDLNFTVTFPAVFAIVTATPVAGKSITIRSENGVGNSTTNKVLALTTALGAVGTNTNSYVNPTTLVANATLFGKCATQTISVPRVPSATSYVWTLQNGAVFVGDATSFQVTIDFSLVATPTATTKNIVKVKAWNGCNYSAEKSISLTWDGTTTCPDSGDNKQSVPTAVASNVSEIYPNPAVDTFNFDLSSTLGSEVSLTIYAINGAIVKTSKVQLVEGFNTVSEDVSNLGKGIYFVKLYNATNNETIVRKLVKR